MTECFSCHKKLARFDERGDKDFIIRRGYQPKEEMPDDGVLCEDCLDQVRNTQVRGETNDTPVNMGWLIFMIFIFPIYSFWRIEKLTRFFMIYFVLCGGGMGIGMGLVTFGYSIDPNSSQTYGGIGMGLEYLGWVIFFIAYGGGIPLGVYLIVKWTRKYNAYVINPKNS